jgi:hypothetical protein
VANKKTTVNNKENTDERSKGFFIMGFNFYILLIGIVLDRQASTNMGISLSRSVFGHLAAAGLPLRGIAYAKGEAQDYAISLEPVESAYR